jgi:cobalt-zinc-cadmium efflux system membrane fusion protein
MIINIKRKVLTLAVLVVAMSFYSCGNQSQKSAADNSLATKELKEEEHSEEANIATLTAAQIKEVGITLGQLEYKQLDAAISANGVLRVPNDSKGTATSLYGGVIKSLSVQVGDYVNKGQVLARIANPQFVQLQEEYLTINSRLVLAENEQRRQEELYAGNAGARKNLQMASTELSTLRTRKASLRQQLALMGINLATISDGNLQATVGVKSPISGAVSNMFGKIGTYVDAATPIMEIINNSSLHLDLQVFEKDLPKMKVGQLVHFNLTNNPNTENDAKVFSIGSSFENESKTIAVHAKVLGKAKGLIDGMNVTGMISLNNVTTVAVPNDAIVQAEGKFFIFVERKSTETKHEEAEETSGKPHEHQEEAGRLRLEKVEVIKGVSSMGYTGITFVSDVPKETKIVTKGAFFVNAKLSSGGDHAH